MGLIWKSMLILFTKNSKFFFGLVLSHHHREKLLNTSEVGISPVLKFVYIKKSLSGKNNLKFLHLFLEAVLGDIYRWDFFFFLRYARVLKQWCRKSMSFERERYVFGPLLTNHWAFDFSKRIYRKKVRCFSKTNFIRLESTWKWLHTQGMFPKQLVNITYRYCLFC